MSKIINLDPSIARIVNINPVGFNETRRVFFRASANFVGDFEFVVYDSSAKKTTLKPTGALAVVNDLMTLTLSPSSQGIAIQANYYEIFEKDSKSVIFKGLLNIVK
jgi:tRNA(Leu) C34 or U34 (ribose-2'-O)-methylase TrmL